MHNYLPVLLTNFALFCFRKLNISNQHCLICQGKVFCSFGFSLLQKVIEFTSKKPDSFSGKQTFVCLPRVIL